jgi:hypothetical protein
VYFVQDLGVYGYAYREESCRSLLRFRAPLQWKKKPKKQKREENQKQVALTKHNLTSQHRNCDDIEMKPKYRNQSQWLCNSSSTKYGKYINLNWRRG